MADGDKPEITTREVDDLLKFFTEDQVRLMAERWDELKAAIRRWRVGCCPWQTAKHQYQQRPLHRATVDVDQCGPSPPRQPG